MFLFYLIVSFLFYFIWNDAIGQIGGVACALGGAALGATGIAGPPTSHLTAALLMIGMYDVYSNLMWTIV